MPPSLELVLGPMLMGTIINVFLFGIMVMQCYMYYLWYKQDRLRIKITVYFLLLLDTVSSAFDIAMTYEYLILSFGSLEGISVINIGITPYPILSGLTTLVVQTFFAWRVNVLTEFHLLSIGICILSIIQFLASIGTTIGGVIVHNLAELGKVKSVALTWLVVGAVNDLIITFVLVFYLRRRRTGHSRTDDLISRIVRLTVQTGLITSLWAVAVVIAYLVSESSMHLAFGIPLSKLYTNTLMSTLNMRRGWSTSGYTTATGAQLTSVHPARNIHVGPGSKSASHSNIVNFSTIGAIPGRTSHEDSQPDQFSERDTESQREMNTIPVPDAKEGYTSHV